jgi:hypothetical protein
LFGDHEEDGMKNPLVAMLMLGALAAIAAAPGAQAQRLLSVEPDSSLVYIGDLFDLDVMVNGDVDGLMGYNVTIRFDPLYVEIVNASEGSLPALSGHDTFFRWLNAGCGCDSIRVNGSILGGAVDGPGPLARLRFKALCAGYTYVEIVRSDLRDADNNKLAHVRGRAKVMIESPIGVSDASWGSIKALYR